MAIATNTKVTASVTLLNDPVNPAQIYFFISSQWDQFVKILSQKVKYE